MARSAQSHLSRRNSPIRPRWPALRNARAIYRLAMPRRLRFLLRLLPRARAARAPVTAYSSTVMTYPEDANLSANELRVHHAGDLAILNAALAELNRVCPTNPLLQPEVAKGIYEMGVYTFQHHGWRAAQRLSPDPHALQRDHAHDFEARRQHLIEAIGASPIERRTTRRLLLLRQQTITWRGRLYPSMHAAQTAKNAELARLRRCTPGEQLERRAANA